MDLSIDIPGYEWLAALSILGSTSADERSSLGFVQLIGDGERRRWVATNFDTLTAVDGDLDPGEYQLLLSPRLIRLGVAASALTGQAALAVAEDGDGDRHLTVVGAELSGTFDESPYAFRDALALLRTECAHPGVRVRVSADALLDLVALGRQAPAQPDTERRRIFAWLSTDEGALELSIDWELSGNSTYRITADAKGGGTARAAVEPHLLAELASGFSGEIDLVLPTSSDGTVRLEAPERTALLRPFNTSFERHRDQVESVLADVFGRDSLYRDADGDYKLDVHGSPVYARLVDGDPPGLQLFAVAVRGIDSSHELLREINEYNARFGFARTFWVNGDVLVESDLVAATADPDEVLTSFEQVLGVSHTLGPMLATMFGGEVVNSRADRWASYCNTLISAESAPGQGLDLNGPEGESEWPFNTGVFVLTAWNPQGRIRPADDNEERNNDLGAALLRAGCGLMRAVGRDVDGEYFEPGFLVWGIDRETARFFGRQFAQDAIFEIDADEIHIVSCVDDQVVSGPRQVLPIAAHDE